MYHRIAFDQHDPFKLAVSPEHFAEHLSRIRRVADIVPLSEVRQLRPKRPRVAITLDDGYADNANVGLNLLKSADAAATVFVTTCLVGSGATLWPLRLEDLFRSGRPKSRHLELLIGGRKFLADVGSAGARHDAMRAVHQRLRTEAPTDVAQVLAAIEQFFGPLAFAESRRMMSALEVQSLASSGLVSVGAHTRQHPWLAALPAAAQAAEISGARNMLQQLVGRPVDQFAYPFGSRDAYNRHSVSAVRKAGFKLACTTLPGRVVATTSRFLLPRRNVVDCDGTAFETRLERWLSV